MPPPNDRAVTRLRRCSPILGGASRIGAGVGILACAAVVLTSAPTAAAKSCQDPRPNLQKLETKHLSCGKGEDIALQWWRRIKHDRCEDAYTCKLPNVRCYSPDPIGTHLVKCRVVEGSGRLKFLVVDV